MTYIVVYQREDGSSGLEECADLDLAIVTAERLRNVDSVERPRIFKTSEITYDFKPYYRVEVTTADSNEDHSAKTIEKSPPPPSVKATPATPVVDVDPPVESSDDSEDAVAEEEAAEEKVDAKSSLAKKAEAAVAKETGEAKDDNAAVDADAIDTKSGTGLFGDRTKTEESTEFPAVTTEEAPPEASPPRRGLFGR